MANSQGDSVKASDFNALFTRLEAVRKKQYARPDVTASNLSRAWSGPAVVGEKPVPSNIQSAKDKVRALENGVSNISGFSSSIVVPSVGDLLKASTISLVETAVRRVEGACVNCNNNANFSVNGFNSNDGNFGNYGNDGNDGNNGNNGYSCATCFSNWGHNCSWF